MSKFKIMIYCLPIVILASCGETKTIFKSNKIYKYVNNQGTDKNDQIIEYTVINKFKSTIKDKTDFYQINNVEAVDIYITDSAFIDPSKVVSYIGLENTYYVPENKIFMNGKEFNNSSLKFFYGKFAFTGMAIPLKYRGGVGNDTINPPTFETSFNVNFAPSYRLNWSSYNPSKNVLGNNLTNYSLTFGGLLGIGATDLKSKTNSVGLLSDRKAGVFTFGGMILFGFNTIGIGYSIGFDNIIGEGGKYWVYQNKIWHGITVSIDIIK